MLDANSQGVLELYLPHYLCCLHFGKSLRVLPAPSKVRYCGVIDDDFLRRYSFPQPFPLGHEMMSTSPTCRIEGIVSPESGTTHSWCKHALAPPISRRILTSCGEELSLFHEPDDGDDETSAPHDLAMDPFTIRHSSSLVKSLFSLSRVDTTTLPTSSHFPMFAAPGGGLRGLCPCSGRPLSQFP